MRCRALAARRARADRIEREEMDYVVRLSRLSEGFVLLPQGSRSASSTVGAGIGAAWSPGWCWNTTRSCDP